MQKSLMHGHPQYAAWPDILISLLTVLCRKLEVELSETTFIHKVFGGKLRSRVSCESCGYNSDTFDRILDLSLDIIKTDSLKEALSSFISPDHLKGTDKYKCEKYVFHSIIYVHPFLIDPTVGARSTLTQKSGSQFTKLLRFSPCTSNAFHLLAAR